MARVVVFDETGGPQVLRVVEESAGDPGPGEVRVRIEAFAVNRLDELTRRGVSPRRSVSRTPGWAARGRGSLTRSAPASRASASATPF